MKLQLKQLKTAGGDETLRFTTELYLDRHKIAIVSNGGTGGGNQSDFLGTDSRSMFTDYIDRLRTKPLEVADLLHQKLAEFLQDSQAIIHTFTQQDLDADIVINCAIKLQDDLKFFKKQCKNKTLFRLPKDPKNEYRTVEKSFSPELESWLVTKYGADVTIINKFLARSPKMSKFND
jgi:hypothetical protein